MTAEYPCFSLLVPVMQGYSTVIVIELAEAQMPARLVYYHACMHCTGDWAGQVAKQELIATAVPVSGQLRLLGPLLAGTIHMLLLLLVLHTFFVRLTMSPTVKPAVSSYTCSNFVNAVKQVAL